MRIHQLRRQAIACTLATLLFVVLTWGQYKDGGGMAVAVYAFVSVVALTLTHIAWERVVDCGAAMRRHPSQR